MVGKGNEGEELAFILRGFSADGDRGINCHCFVRFFKESANESDSYDETLNPFGSDSDDEVSNAGAEMKASLSVIPPKYYFLQHISFIVWFTSFVKWYDDLGSSALWFKEVNLFFFI